MSVNYNVPVYDPCGDRGESYLHPANLETRFFIEIVHIYQDISALFEILNGLKERRKCLCILKHIVLDWLSLDEHLIKLSSRIIGKKCQFPVSSEAIDKIKILKKEYECTKEEHFPKLKNTRNKIIAHRDVEDLPSLHDVASLVDSLDPEIIFKIINKAQPLAVYIQDIGILSWTKKENGITAVIQPFNVKICRE